MHINKQSAVIAIGLIVAIGLAATIYLSGKRNAAAPPAGVGISPIELLGLADDEFTPIKEIPELNFPADHAAHPRYRSDGWDFSGVLTDADAQIFAMNLSVLRIALRSEAAQPDSRWRASEAYAGLLSLSDPATGRLHVAERASRASLGLAGARLDPLRIWVEDWRLEGIPAGSEPFFLYGRVGTENVSLNLKFSSRVPFIDSSALQQQATGGTAPFAYYTQPQIDAVGTLRRGHREVSVSGNFIMEHAWGELPLPGSPVARDRFTLFLDDEREISLIRTHRTDGSGAPRTIGLLIGGDGAPGILREQAIELSPTKYWTSARTGARYPTHWTLHIPDFDIELRLVPKWIDQEGVSWSPFWMGPVRLESPSSARSGFGMMILNGYEGARP